MFKTRTEDIGQMGNICCSTRLECCLESTTIDNVPLRTPVQRIIHGLSDEEESESEEENDLNFEKNLPQRVNNEILEDPESDEGKTDYLLTPQKEK